jgi:hypothetical protein
VDAREGAEHFFHDAAAELGPERSLEDRRKATADEGF